MKGIVLAGGLGTRLRPLTKVTNKHLLPVYDRPMIYYPLETLRRAGIREIMLVTGGNSAGDFLRLLGNGAEFGLDNIYYAYQEGERGIADALRLCEHFAEGQRIVVILGDNILEDDIAAYVRQIPGAELRRAHPLKGSRRSAAFRRTGHAARPHRPDRGEAREARRAATRLPASTCSIGASSNSSRA